MTQQLLTPYQSQYMAWLLTRRAPSDTVESLASTLVDSQVDLNPHQKEAALFACQNPLSRGVFLADEVGLGKTIEAGLVIAQRWAERRRRILIIIPANLRKQWLNASGPVICSYQFAKTKVHDLKTVAWDRAVMDEAHRTRNVYKTCAVTCSITRMTSRRSITA